MKKLTLTLAAVGAAVAAASYAAPPYTMTQIWKADAGGSLLAWFLNDNNTRGLCYYEPSDTLLVPDRGPANAVYRLDPATAAAKTPNALNVTGVSLGTIQLNLINATSDGKLFLTNVAAATSTFKIYYYANETAAPVTAYSEANVSVRYGDSVDVKGSGSNIELLVSGSGNPNVAVFTSTDGGATFTKQDITLNTALVGTTYVKWDPQASDAFYARKAASTGTETSALKRYTISGTAGTSDTVFGAKLPLAGVGAFDVKVTPGSHLIVANTFANATAGASNLKGTVYHVASQTLLAETAAGLEAGSAANTNLNGSGAAAIDLTNKRVFFLYTNNSISAWNLPNEVASGVGDWNLY